jgi:hypothetical protein
MHRNVGFSSVVLFLTVLGLISLTASSAVAVKEFKDAFQAKYIKSDSTEPNDVALAQAFDQAGCAVCHAGGNNKRIRNDYGRQLAKLVRKQDSRNKAKIETALDTIAKLKSKPSDPASPTFGERIASGKLPASEPGAARAGDFGPPGQPRENGQGWPRPPRPDGRPGEPDDRQNGPPPGLDGPPGGPGSLGPGQSPGFQPRGPRPDLPQTERNDPEIDKLLQNERDLNKRTHETAKEYRAAPEDQRDKLKDNLKKLVTEQVKTYQQRRKLELIRLEAEVKRLTDAADRLDKNSEKIIDKRVSELLGEL